MRIELKEIRIDEPQKTVKAIRLDFSNDFHVAVAIDEPYDMAAVAFTLIQIAHRLIKEYDKTKGIIHG